MTDIQFLGNLNLLFITTLFQTDIKKGRVNENRGVKLSKKRCGKVNDL